MQSPFLQYSAGSVRHAIQIFVYCARKLSHEPSTHSPQSEKKTIAYDDIQITWKTIHMVCSMLYTECGRFSIYSVPTYYMMLKLMCPAWFTRNTVFITSSDNEWWRGATDCHISFFFFFHLPPQVRRRNMMLMGGGREIRGPYDFI